MVTKMFWTWQLIDTTCVFRNLQEVGGELQVTIEFPLTLPLIPPMSPVWFGLKLFQGVQLLHAGQPLIGPCYSIEKNLVHVFKICFVMYSIYWNFLDNENYITT